MNTQQPKVISPRTGKLVSPATARRHAQAVEYRRRWLQAIADERAAWLASGRVVPATF